MLNWINDTGGIFNALLPSLIRADQRALKDILELLGSLPVDSIAIDELADAMFHYIERAYHIEFSGQDFKEMVHSQINTIYKESMAKDGLRVRTQWTLVDTKAAEFLERSDLFYLGKYIQDPGTKTRILEYIKKAYIEEGRGIGNSPKELRAFMDALGSQLELERYQARRIIDTTVSHARTFSQITGLRQATVKTFTIVGPLDNLTCAFCHEMVGKSFSLATEVAALDSLLAAGPEAMSVVRPFLKGSILLEDLKNMSDGMIQEMGFALPPYHPSCRHSLAVDTFYENPEDVPYPVEMSNA